MAKINIKPDIRELPLSCIKPFVNNPRDITTEALSGLRSSLEKFGYVDLLIVNKRNMELVAGHQRLKILQDEGVEWEIDWEGKKRNSGLNHPTVKPTEIFAIPMRVHTKPGDICYEPFSGSGSQIIAAERLGRRCFAMELESVFCDVAVRRWEEFTGKKAGRQ